MKLLQLDFQIIEQEPGLDGIYKAAELPGRICYGSTDKITAESAKPFIDNLMKVGHGAPLEHASVYLIVPEDNEHISVYENNPYTKCSYSGNKLYVSTNLRVLYDNGLLDDLKYLSPMTDLHERRVMVKFTANRGVTAEFNRHRKDSINEESTRYCNYSKDKYGNEISVITNNNMFSGHLDTLSHNNDVNDIYHYCLMIGSHLDNEFQDFDYWLFANKACEYSYIKLTQKFNWKAQDARDILPLDLKSNLIHTAFISDWIHFFNLRAIGTTGKPHPQAKELAYPLMEEFIKRNYIKKTDVAQEK